MVLSPKLDPVQFVKPGDFDPTYILSNDDCAILLLDPLAWRIETDIGISCASPDLQAFDSAGARNQSEPDEGSAFDGQNLDWQYSRSS
ncbi:hypothetical protein CKAH01_17790 [Colletotrichum kahawae]|uniref:Uncharacterized protein n=1 Tax=Colletotrichum kahawae TaxID=34407 RepID=A0AAD9YA70_COLKA|nr:hypothetical protein CKAH01_17790 [Colletotrichum kahawae]